MSKRFLVIAGVLLVMGGLVVTALKWFSTRDDTAPAFTDKEMARSAARVKPGAPVEPATVPEVPLMPSQTVRLAVGWLGLRDKAQNEDVADMLTAALSNGKGLELVDRQSLGAVLRELELNLAGVVRANEAVRIGKLLRADWFLVGSMASSGSSNAIVARIIDALRGGFSWR